MIIIPENITVHTGPPDAPAPNVTLQFTDYIKKAVSGAVNPLWQEATLRAIICAQQTFALNRLNTSYYRGRGYDFDITGDGEYDQDFFPDHCVFANINRFTDEAYRVYITRQSGTEPLLTPYKLESTATEPEVLSAENAVRLAEEGLSALEILRKTFGDDIELTQGGDADGCSYDQPHRILTLGQTGREVSDIQRRLNLISTSFPNIPKINPADGMYGPGTEAAVKEFQNTFNLPADGSVGISTCRRIRLVYNTVRRLLRLNTENMLIPASCGAKGACLTEGDKGDNVRLIQYILNYIAQYVNTVKSTPIDGVYGRSTTESVVDFQRTFGLPLTGDVDKETYDMMYDVYYGITDTRRREIYTGASAPFPGETLRFGMQNEEVRRLQEYLNCASELYSDNLGRVTVTGVYGVETRNAVKALQRLHRLPQTGATSREDWEMIMSLVDDCAAAKYLNPGQFPGYLIERRQSKGVQL